MKNDQFHMMRAAFENINAMVTENYDDILKTTFGNYMQLPPEEKRIPHNNAEIYWKE